MTDAVLPEGAPQIVTVAPASAASASGAVTGGWMFTRLDEAVGRFGREMTGGAAIIIKISELVFHAPLAAEETFAVYVSLVRKGNSSFGLTASGWSGTTSNARLVLSAEVLMVAVDDDGKPRKIQ